ncbi:hypothetical protein RB623_27235, partial [Mesorhizobium sp. LHD-90]|uniref:hypothetical protein n=1 Tax=Mesorhizobium sp. LHD-90 TaxID=3071414 RepID=UPI0027DFB3B3
DNVKARASGDSDIEGSFFGETNPSFQLILGLSPNHCRVVWHNRRESLDSGPIFGPMWLTWRPVNLAGTSKSFTRSRLADWRAEARFAIAE